MFTALSYAALLTIAQASTPTVPEGLPDAIDIFVGPPGGKTNVELLVDASASMNGSPVNSACTWFAANYNGGSTALKKIDQLKATLIGCRTETDGVLDKYA